jgi:transposase
MNGMSSKEIAEKYGVSQGQVNKLKRDAFGLQKPPRDDRRLSELEQRVATLEEIVNTFFRYRLENQGIKRI